MYRNRKFNRNARLPSKEDRKRELNPIDENASIKIARKEKSAANKSKEPEKGTLDEMPSSEENIPASQEMSQRYLSQRSAITCSLMRTQSRNKTYRPPNTYFELVMMKAGVQLDESDSFVLSCDHIAFVSNFRDIFTQYPNYPDNIETFKTGLYEALADNCKYKLKLLNGCTISAPNEESVYRSQESMIGNLLMISFLCDPVLEVLLNKIEEAATRSASSRSHATTTSLLPLMLAQLRYVSNSHGEVIFKRLKDIFEKANDVAKCAIIESAEFILSPDYHDEFVQMLIDVTSENNVFFSNATVETLTNLCLSTKMHSKLSSMITEYIRQDDSPQEITPLLVRFLLKKLNEVNDDCLKELVRVMREILQHIPAGTLASEKQAQLEVFKSIEQGLINCKKFYTAWQRIIENLSAEQFRSIDFIVLLLLVNIKGDNYLYVENIIRRRIKLQHMTVDLLSDAKAKYSCALEQYTNIVMQMLLDFVKEKNKSIADFGKISYGILFELCESAQKMILKKLMQLTCDKSTHNMTNLALQLLKDLQCKYPEYIQNWGVLLMPLLDRLCDMSLSETRLVMEIVCSIAYPVPPLPECPTLQDQIDMLLKKQLINRSPFVVKQGIVGSVQLIDCIARIEKKGIDSEDLDTSYLLASDLPDGRGKLAAQLIIRLISVCAHCPANMALFLDEMASVCMASPNDRTSSSFLDKPFLIWLCEQMTNNFQNGFVAEGTPDALLGLNLSYQKCINSSEDNTEVPLIAIKISESVLQPTKDVWQSIVILAPLFNLVRVLQFERNEGSLEAINAVLGCAISLPTFFDDPTVENTFCGHEEQMQSKILDIYFYCVNWMRETVSSFATQREEMIRKKVLQRLTDLIEVESKTRQLLRHAPKGYKPPMCNFLLTYKDAGKSKGKNSTDFQNMAQQRANQTCTELSESTLLNNTKVGDVTAKLASVGRNRAARVKKNFEVIYGSKEVYRQMDSSIMLILYDELCTMFPLPVEHIGKKIGLLEFRFILFDLVCKLESVAGARKLSTEQTLQHVAKPEFFMSDLSRFLTQLAKNLEELSIAINERLEQVDRVYSSIELLTDEFCYLKVCFDLCMQLFATFFSWSKFTDTTATNALLKDALLSLLKRSKCKESRGKSVASLAADAFKKFFKYESCIVSLKSAVHLHQLLLTLSRFSNVAENKKLVEKQEQELHTLCSNLLRRKWFNYEGTLEKGAACNAFLDELIKGFLRGCDFRRQQSIQLNLLGECKALLCKEGSLKSLPNIKKANFPLLFRGLCEILISSLTDAIAAGSKPDERIKMFERGCELVNGLKDIVASVEVPRNFQLFLKYAHVFLKLVLQHALQDFEDNLRQDPERVGDFLKNLQVTTRYLHRICCHSKAITNIAIINQIPCLRETLETLLFRVKALLTANKCASVFTMGNLKNKDIHGDEILSQTTTMNCTGEENSDEELPNDDDSVDETIFGASVLEVQGASRTSRSKSSSRSKCF